MDTVTRDTGLRPRFGAHGFAGAMVAAVVGASLLVGCGSSSDPVDLSADAQRGQRLAADYGCSGCHAGLDSSADVGPSWTGAWGSEVRLDDGSTAVIDREFVVAAVRTPELRRRDGDWLRMPVYAEFHLPDDELELIIQYIREIGGGDD